MNDERKPKRGLSLSTQILIGLSLGLMVGLFLGENASSLAVVGRAYIGLIQMSIMP
jgi:proton glutamate symport protein